MLKTLLKLTAKTLTLLCISAVFLFFSAQESIAAVGLSVGNNTLNLLQTENLLYGNVGSGSHASSSFLLFQNNGANRFKVDISGNLTTSGSITANAFTGPLTGQLNAANVSSGQFGSNVGNGNFSFPGNVGIGTTLAESLFEVERSATGTIATFDVNTANRATMQFSIFESYAQIQSYGRGTSSGHLSINPLGNNVGIATTNPGDKLEVNGDIGIMNSSKLNFGSQLQNPPYIRAVWSDNNNTGLEFHTFSSAIDIPALTLSRTGGNVGIGTINPTASLQIYSATPTFRMEGSGFSGNTYTGVGFTPNVTVNTLFHGSRYANGGYGFSGFSGASTEPGLFFIGYQGSTSATAPAVLFSAYKPSGANRTPLTGNDKAFIFQTGIDGTWNTAIMTMLGNGNVGIGTTNPTAKLYVNGTSIFNDVATFTQPVIVGAPVLNAHAATKNYVDSQISSSTGAIAFWGGSLTGNISNSNSGNVGIGTTTPGARLNVTTGKTGQNNIPFLVGGAVNAGTFIDEWGLTRTKASTVIGTYWNTDAAGAALNVYTFTKDGALFVSGGGNVGIGTTAPNYPLEVLKTTADTDVTQLTLKNSDNGVGAGASIGFSPITTNILTGKISNIRDAGGEYSLRFYNYGAGGNAERMRINYLGNVGIGTTTPGTRLTVVGSGNYSIDAGNYRVGNVATPVSALDAVNKTYFDSAVSAAQNAFWNLSGSNLYASSTSWNVGIGTTNTQAKLDVRGSLLSFNGSGGTYHYRNVASISDGSPSITGALKIRMPKSWSNTMMSVTIRGYNYSSHGAWEAVVSGYNYSGSPSWVNASADIKGKAPFSSVRLAHDGTYNVIILGSTSTAWSYPKVDVTDFIAGHSNTEGWGSGWAMSFITDETGIAYVTGVSSPMFTSATGNIGIGMTNPTQKLAVEGGAISVNSSGNGLVYLGSGGSYIGRNNSLFNIRNEGVPFVFINGSTEQVRITNTGNVGIGTTNPTARLYVNGSSIFNDVATFTQPVIVGAPVLNAHAATKNYVDSQISSSTGAIAFWGGSLTGNISNSNSGNVGIGVANPANKLVVKGNGANTGVTIGGATTYEFAIDNIIAATDYLNFRSVNVNTNTTHLNNILALQRSGNVGIGTASPNSRLHVYNTAANAEIDIQSLVGAGNHWGMYSNLGDNSYRIWGGSDYLTILRGGNVGIGATNPNGKLSVNGAVGIGLIASTSPVDNMLDIASDKGSGSGGAIRARYISGGGLLNTEFGALTFKNSQWVATYSRQGSAGAALYTDGEVNMMNGNVGIGTTNPGSKLEITGATLGRNFRIADTGVATFNFSDNAGNTPFISFVQATGYAAVTSNLNWWSSAITGGTSYQSAALRVGHEQDWTTTAGTRDSYFSIFTSLDGALSEKFRINSAGNVGIGTTNPTARLYVNGSSIFNDVATFTQPVIVGAPVLSAHAATKNYVDSQISSSTGAIAFWGGSLTGNISNANSGNVGIGTTTPATKLQIEGSVGYHQLLQKRSGSSQALWSGAVWDSVGSFIGHNAYYSNSFNYIPNYSAASGLEFRESGNIEFFADSGLTSGVSYNPTERMIINTAGNVGIGTMGPNSRLHVYNSTANAEIDIQSLVGAGNHWGLYSNLSDNSFRLWGGSDFMTVLRTSGNIGIGTTTPFSKLHVSGSAPIDWNMYSGKALLTLGDINSSGSMFIHTPSLDGTRPSGLGFDGSYSGGISTLNIKAFGTFTANTTYGSDLAFSTTRGSVVSEVLRLASGGNVGIGTTNPSKKFIVSDTGSTNVVGTMEFGNDNNTYTSLKVLSDGVGFTLKGHTSGGGYISANAALNFSNNDTANAGTLWLGNGNRLRLVDNTGTINYLVVNTAGNVGIGTTTPGTKLTVIGSGNYSIDAGNFRVGNVATPVSPLDAVNKTYLDSAVGAAQNAFWNLSGSNLFASSTSWNVGIGTSSPTTKLDIIGGLRTTGPLQLSNVLYMGGGNRVLMVDNAGNVSATSTAPSASTVPVFVGLTASSYNGTSGSNPGYAYANSVCAAAFSGSHVCTTYEMLNTINASSTMPTADAWVHSGPPGYTALANDCDGRRSASSAAYGAYWQISDSGYAPHGRGLLMTCNNSLQYACCK